MFAFYYRNRLDAVPGAEGRIFAGFSGESDGLIGIDMRIPLLDSLAFEAGFSYLIPQQATTGAAGIPGARAGHEEESWNLAMTLVWYPGCRSAYGDDYFRPLFNVADNTSFRMDRLP